MPAAASGSAPKDRAHGRGPPLRPAVRGWRAVSVEVTGDLPQALASAALRPNPLDHFQRQAWRSTFATRWLRDGGRMDTLPIRSANPHGQAGRGAERIRTAVGHLDSLSARAFRSTRRAPTTRPPSERQRRLLGPGVLNKRGWPCALRSGQRADTRAAQGLHCGLGRCRADLLGSERRRHRDPRPSACPRHHPRLRPVAEPAGGVARPRPAWRRCRLGTGGATRTARMATEPARALHGRLRALQAPPRLPRQHQNFELRGRFFILSPVCSAASSRRPTMCWRRSRCRRGTSTASSRRTLPPPAAAGGRARADRAD